MNDTLDIIQAGGVYLLSHVGDGLCQGFHQLSHGPSQAWTTACIGSTLSEFAPISPEILAAVLKLQWDSGGWSYNQVVPPDADSTLRVMQFLQKVGFRNREVIEKGERFVILHQQADGGVATYLPEAVTAMGYQGSGWTSSHPCVTALASHILRDQQAREGASHYLRKYLNRGVARAYWWRTPWYVLYEFSYPKGTSVTGDDPIEISLQLLLQAKLGATDQALLTKLISLQLSDGSFPISRQFRIPRPDQALDDITGEEEVVADRTRIFSTAAAIVAISRQWALLN